MVQQTAQCVPQYAPINFLYTHFHDSLRSELDVLATRVRGLEVAAVTANSAQLTQQLQQLTEAYRFLEQVYKYHSSVEDEVVYPALDAKVRNVTLAYSVEHQDEEVLFEQLLQLLHTATAEAGPACQNTIRALACKVEEVHTTLRKHLRKEEEQLLPLLLTHFSHGEQAQLVAHFLTCIPLATVERVLAWLKPRIPRAEQEALLSHIASVTPDDLLGQLLTTWLQPAFDASCCSSEGAGDSDEDIQKDAMAAAAAAAATGALTIPAPAAAPAAALAGMETGGGSSSAARGGAEPCAGSSAASIVPSASVTGTDAVRCGAEAVMQCCSLPRSRHLACPAGGLSVLTKKQQQQERKAVEHSLQMHSSGDGALDTLAVSKTTAAAAEAVRAAQTATAAAGVAVAAATTATATAAAAAAELQDLMCSSSGDGAPLRGIIHFHTSICSALNMFAQEARHLQASPDVSANQLSGLVEAHRFLRSVYVFHSTSEEEVMFPEVQRLRAAAGGEALPSGCGSCEAEHAQELSSFDDLGRMLSEVRSFARRGRKEVAPMLAQLCTSAEATAAAISNHMRREEAEVFPLLEANLCTAQQRAMLWRTLRAMPLRLLERVMPWVVGSLSEADASQLLFNVRLGAPEADHALVELLTRWAMRGVGAGTVPSANHPLMLVRSGSNGCGNGSLAPGQHASMDPSADNRPHHRHHNPPHQQASDPTSLGQPTALLPHPHQHSSPADLCHRRSGDGVLLWPPALPPAGITSRASLDGRRSMDGESCAQHQHHHHQHPQLLRNHSNGQHANHKQGQTDVQAHLHGAGAGSPAEQDHECAKRRRMVDGSAFKLSCEGGQVVDLSTEASGLGGLGASTLDGESEVAPRSGLPDCSSSGVKDLGQGTSPSSRSSSPSPHPPLALPSARSKNLFNPIDHIFQFHKALRQELRQLEMDALALEHALLEAERACACVGCCPEPEPAASGSGKEAAAPAANIHNKAHVSGDSSKSGAAGPAAAAALAAVVGSASAAAGVGPSAGLASCIAAVHQLDGRFQFLWGIYRAHSQAEDQIVFPALESKHALRNVSHAYTLDHEQEERLFLDLDEVIQKLKGRGTATIPALLEAAMGVRPMCAAIRASLETHIRSEEAELWPLFSEHFTVEEQQYLVGVIIGRTGATVLQALLPWITDSFPLADSSSTGDVEEEADEKVAMMDSLREATKNTMFGQWLDAVRLGTQHPPDLLVNGTCGHSQPHTPASATAAAAAQSSAATKEATAPAKAHTGVPLQAGVQATGATDAVMQQPAASAGTKGGAGLGSALPSPALSQAEDLQRPLNEVARYLAGSGGLEAPGATAESTAFRPGWEDIFRMNQKQLEAAIHRVSSDPTLEPGRKAYLIQNLMVSKYVVAQQERMNGAAAAAAAAAAAIVAPPTVAVVPAAAAASVAGFAHAAADHAASVGGSAAEAAIVAPLAAALEAALAGPSSGNQGVPGRRRVTYHDAARDMWGCQHYSRRCQLVAPCCDRLYTCRLCHDEDSSHRMDRYSVSEMACMGCGLRQPVAANCSGCGDTLARYYCQICHLFDDTPGRDIYHCPFCNVCRRGKGLGIDFFHCMNCNACMSLSLFSSHKCRDKCLENNCPVCSEYMFDSSAPIKELPCGHLMHSSCFAEYTRYNYTCPLCSKSCGDMSVYFQMLDSLLASERLPPEFAGRMQQVLCHDCNRMGFAPYHFVYHACPHCRSYNTRVL